MIAAFACMALLVCVPMTPQQHSAHNRVLLPVRVVTVYHAVEAQTDAEPLVTADGSYLTPEIVEYGRYAAVSQEMLWFKGGPLRFGDVIHIAGIGGFSGHYFVHDTMAPEVTGYVDLLVPEGVLEVWTKGAEVSHEPETGSCTCAGTCARFGSGLFSTKHN